MDVTTTTYIGRTRDQVAAFAVDPDRVTDWYANIVAVEWKTPPPLVVGTRLGFMAKFLGRRLAYTYEVKEHEPGQRFVMSTAEGPFPMETTYEFSDGPAGGTTVRLTNRGSPRGLSRLMAPFVSGAVRRATRRDLARLKERLEGAPATP